MNFALAVLEDCKVFERKGYWRYRWVLWNTF